MILASAPQLAALTHLSLIDCGIGGEGLQVLGASAHLKNLVALSLHNNSIGIHSVVSLRALANSPVFGRLSSLDLSLNQLCVESVTAALVSAPNLGRLRRLDLHANGIGEEAAAVLASGRFTSLQTLVLDYNRINAAGARRRWRALLIWPPSPR